MDSRALTPAEHELLTFLLSNMGARAASLLPHLDGAEVIDEDDPAMWLQIKVRPESQPVDLPSTPIPGSAVIEGPAGELTGELFVWMRNGRLDALRQASYTDEPVTSMPSIESIRIYPAPRWA